MATVQQVFHSAITDGDWEKVRKVYKALTGDEAPTPPAQSNILDVELDDDEETDYNPMEAEIEDDEEGEEEEEESFDFPSDEDEEEEEE